MFFTLLINTEKMANIFVSWGGDLDISAGFDSYFLSHLNGEKIWYIPRAMPSCRYQSCLERIDNFLPKNKWFDVLLLDEGIDYSKDKSLLDQLDAIYIWWGNTYRLMSICRNNNFFEFLKCFILTNKPVYWGSAGAILLGKNIHSSPDANIANISEEQAQWLNQFSDISFFCHYTMKDDWQILEYITYHHSPVVALPEWTGVIAKDWSFLIQGNSSAYLFSYWKEKRELKVWEKI